MKDRILADLDARIEAHTGGDSTGVLDERALDLVTELVTAGGPDAGSLVRVAALHLCRYQALPPELGEADLRMARTLYARLHAVDPRLVPARVRDFFGLASPHDQAVALMAEYERTGRLEDLERAISLFRQEVLEHRADARHLRMALLRRYRRTGQAVDLDEVATLTRAAAEPTETP